MHNIESIKNGIEKHWGGLPVCNNALKIVDAVSKLDLSGEKYLYLSEIKQMMGGNSTLEEAFAALAVLTQSEFYIFDSSGAFIDEDEQVYKLPTSCFQEVLNQNTLAHPVTGAEVLEASKKVFPIFEIKREIFNQN